MKDHISNNHESKLRAEIEIIVTRSVTAALNLAKRCGDMADIEQWARAWLAGEDRSQDVADRVASAAHHYASTQCYGRGWASRGASAIADIATAASMFADNPISAAKDIATLAAKAAMGGEIDRDPSAAYYAERAKQEAQLRGVGT